MVGTTGYQFCSWYRWWRAVPNRAEIGYQVRYLVRSSWESTGERSLCIVYYIPSLPNQWYNKLKSRDLLFVDLIVLWFSENHHLIELCSLLAWINTGTAAFGYSSLLASTKLLVLISIDDDAALYTSSTKLCRTITMRVSVLHGYNDDGDTAMNFDEWMTRRRQFMHTHLHTRHPWVVRQGVPSVRSRKVNYKGWINPRERQECDEVAQL